MVPSSCNCLVTNKGVSEPVICVAVISTSLQQAMLTNDRRCLSTAFKLVNYRQGIPDAEDAE